ncbi:MAG: hypothetical protein K5849_04390, partial [Bacteroidales bacterium]|nr:hypothetical protein [Bacteroidales bacterium]
MNRLFLTLAAISLGCISVTAQPVQSLADSKFELKNGEVTMTVDAARGGKILSFRLQDKEVLSQTRFP